ncbi:MAG: hypothetical protein K2P30_16380 [Lachnospiraceae bacterium]|nr:hypothetical protein [Lachnospiraceae bacterium]
MLSIFINDIENIINKIGDAHIIYSGSADDAERFKTLQARLKSNLSDDKFVREIAVRRCEEAGRLCAMLNQSHIARGNQSASEVRKTAGFIIMTLADAVAVYNHTYYHYGLKKQFEDLQNNIPNIPRNIVDGYQNVVKATDIDDVAKYALKLFEDVCSYLGVTFVLQAASELKSQTANKVDASWLAVLYEEISSTFNKIYVCCETGNYILAFLSAVCLQRELDDAKEAGCPAYELLSSFNYKKLCELSETTRRVESDFRKLITVHGGYIRQYDSFEQFESAKL